MATGCVGSDRSTTIPPADTSSTVGSAETGWFGRLLGALGTGKAMPSTLATFPGHSLIWVRRRSVRRGRERLYRRGPDDARSGRAGRRHIPLAPADADAAPSRPAALAVMR